MRYLLILLLLLNSAGAQSIRYANAQSRRMGLGLGNVENVALSTWAGSSNITTIGTLSAGNVPWTLITSKPTTLSGYGITDAAPATHTHGWSDITGKPAFFSGAYAELTGRPTLFSGSYLDLTNKPTLFSGAYADLTGKPALFSGSYTDLTNKPPIPAQVNADWNSVSGASQIMNKPTIPAAQVQSDWNAVSGLGVILNKPTIPVIPARVFSNTAVRPLVTAAAAANGFQASASRDVLVSYSVTVTGTTTISAGGAGHVLLEICPTNSATAAAWVEIARGGGGQTAGLAVGLAMVTINSQPLTAIVPAGYFARLRTVIISGSPTFTYNSGQETQL